MLRLTTLGALDLRDRLGKPMREVLAQPKRVALLVYLAVEGRRGPVPRDRLLALFWPESDSRRGRNTLSQALHQLRQALGPGVLESQGLHVIGVDGGQIWCDATQFADALERGDAELALDLYRGEFCPTLFVSGAPDAEAWLEEQRGRLRASAQAAALALAERLAESGDGAGAARAARRALALRPDDERDVRALIALLDGTGDAVGALLAYQEYARRLAAELEMEPAPETRRLVETIRARREPIAPEPAAAASVAPPAAPPAPAPPGMPAARRRPIWLALAAVTALAAIAAVWSLGARPHLPPPDHTLLVVTPLRVLSPDTSLAYLGDGLADLVAAKVSIPGRIRTADLRTVADAGHAAGSPAVLRDEATNALVARRIGAGQLVTGTIVGTPLRLYVTARWRTVDGARSEDIVASSPIDSLAALADRLAHRILAASALEPSARHEQLGEVGITALEPYLRGRAAFRAGRYAEAVAQFDAAVGADSGFALAALERVQAADFLPGGCENGTCDHAWQLRDRLDARDRTLLEAVLGPAYPRRPSRIQLAGAWERLTRLAPESPEAWYGFGDELFHYGAFLGRDSAFVRAEAALGRAVGLDSSFAAPLAHLVQIAAAREDRRAVQRLAALYFARDTVSDAARFLRWRVALALGDSAAARRIEGDLAALPVATIQLIAEWSLIEGLSGTTAYRMAEALYRRAGRSDVGSDYAARLLLAVATATGHVRRADGLAAERQRGPSGSTRWWRATCGLWFDGPTAALDSMMAQAWRWATEGDRTRAAAMRVAWSALTATTDSVAADALERYESHRSLGAQDEPITMALGAARLRRPDAERQLARLDSVRLAAVEGLTGTLLAETYARLLLGDARGAAALAARRPLIPDWYAASLFRAEGRARQSAGDTAGAIRAYRRYRNLREAADADARPWADSVRAAVARLGGRWPPSGRWGP